MYALANPDVGQIAVSRKGHDSGRTYLIVAVLSEFALCVDGKYRPIDKPKTKRIKHLGYVGDCESARKDILGRTLTDAKARKYLAQFAQKDTQA